MARAKSTVPEPFYLNPEDGKLMLTTDQITVGQRHRKAKGKLAALKKSITDVGQLQPIVVDKDRNLIAGWRRLIALTELNMDAEVTIARDLDDATAALRAERDENTCREDFTPAEALELARAIKGTIAPAAEARKKAGKKVTPPEGGDEPSRNLRTDEQAAAATGRSAATLRKIEKIKSVAFDQDSPVASHALAQSFWDKCENDPTVKIDPLYKALMAQLKADEESRLAEAEARMRASAGEFIDMGHVNDTGDVEPEGSDTPPVVEKAPPRVRITTRVNELIATLTGIGASLDELYADDRFEKSAHGPVVAHLGKALGDLVEAFGKATAVLTPAEEEAAAFAATAADPRYTQDPTSEPNAGD